jgi:hypothetical protein
MRVAGVTLAYNDEGVIRGTLRSLKPFVDKHIVLISEIPYYGEHKPPDRTEDICHEEGAEVVKGSWVLDHYQRNVGNQLCQDCDWILGFDSDEMMTEKQMEMFLGFLGRVNADAISNKPEIYWKTTDYRLRPFPGYTPIIAMRPKVRFTHIRNIDHPFVEYNDPMHHLSWCAPKDIHKKVTNYAHAPDYNWEEWYWDFYDKWDFEKDKTVTFPGGDSYEAIKKPLPKELLEHLKIGENDGIHELKATN